MKSNYKYHAISSLLFLGIGGYFLRQNLAAESQQGFAGSMHNYLPYVILLWGAFKGINAYLLFQKQKSKQ
jgi:hypothetical protein